jgi:hypothetical protein
MVKALNTPDKSLLIKQHEDTKKRHSAQTKRFFNYLKKHTVSCSMASKYLRIPQKCLTRYKRTLERSGNLWQVKKHRCKITGRMVWFLSTNPDFTSNNNQLTIF